MTFIVAPWNIPSDSATPITVTLIGTGGTNWDPQTTTVVLSPLTGSPDVASQVFTVVGPSLAYLTLTSGPGSGSITISLLPGTDSVVMSVSPDPALVGAAVLSWQQGTPPVPLFGQANPPPPAAFGQGVFGTSYFSDPPPSAGAAKVQGT